MHFVDRKPKGEQPRLLTPHPDTSILYSSCPDGGTGRRKGLKIPGPQGCAGSIPALGTKTKRTGTIQIHTRLPFKISPFTLVVAIANANRRLTRRAIRHSLARNSAHPVLVFSLCWHSICRAPEISLRGFLFRLRAWDTAAPSTAGVCAMTASKKGCTGTDDTQAGSPVLYFRAAHARARLIFDASS